MERKILHVDVNNAFLSWTAVWRLNNGETLDIRNIPAVIGGDETKRKGVVLAKSNIAKQFGIKTGEPLFMARKKCPQIQIFSSDFKVYSDYSQKLYDIYSEYTDKIERFSVDECFLDMTNFINNKDSLLEIGRKINKKVRENLGFTVNVGVAENKLLAKMASDFEKPDKVHTLWKEEIPEKMWTLPISELFMVGRKSIPKLEKMGIYKIGDLARKPKEQLISKFGKYGKMIWEYANGIDDEKVHFEKERPKGIGNSITLPYDYESIEKLDEVLLALVEQVSYRLRKNALLANVVNVQIKTNEFKIYSHQKKMDVPTCSTKVIYDEAKKLLEYLKQNRKIRLIGIRVDNLTDIEQTQLSIFENPEIEKQEKLDKAIDKLKKKYGYLSVTRAGKMEVDKKINFKD